MGSVVVMVVGLDNIINELKAASCKPYLLSDLLWLLSKSLKSKNTREHILKSVTVAGLVRQVFSYVV